MRSMYSKDVLLKDVAKKKPRLQAILDNLSQYSDEQLDSLSEPLWIRQAFKILKQTGGLDQKERMTELIRSFETREAFNRSNMTQYPVYWNKVESGLKYRSNHNIPVTGWIALEPNSSFMVMDGAIKIGSHLVTGVYDLDTSNAELLSMMTLPTYLAFNQEIINRKYMGNLNA